MILERGNMWSVFGNTDLFLVTTNPIIRKDGAVVMGRGIALEMKTKYPQFPYDFAQALTWNLGNSFGTVGIYDNQQCGYFMTKNHWKDHSLPKVIRKSVDELCYFISDHDGISVDLNFPGIGNGKLKREDVLPLLQRLPDNVHIWEHE